MNDGASTNCPFTSALFSHVYTFDSLVRITHDGDRPTFYHDIASSDAEILTSELKAGLIDICDLNNWISCYCRTIGLLKKLKREGRSSWVSQDWIAGERNGHKIK